MGFLDHTTNSIIVDAVLTDHGRKLLSEGEFKISYFKFSDDEILDDAVSTNLSAYTDSTGDFYFHQDVQSIFSKKVDADTNYVSDLRKIDIKDGTVIFFDGSLNHSVSPNTTRNLRITTAWNLKPYYPEK